MHKRLLIFAVITIPNIIKTETTSHTLALGESVDFNLPANSSTGYSWRVNCTPQEIVTSQQTYKSPAVQRPGARGSVQITITGKEKGSTVCVFDYGRPWDQESYNNSSRQEHYFVVHE